MKEIEKQKILKSLFCSDEGKENEDTPRDKKNDDLDNTDYEIV